MVDDWKIPIFKKHFDGALIRYDEPIGFTKGTSIFKIYPESIAKAHPIIEAAALECARAKP